jgi:hypothetical protein
MRFLRFGYDWFSACAARYSSTVVAGLARKLESA